MVLLEMILINKSRYNLDECKKYLMYNNYKYNDVEETKNYFKFRQLNHSNNAKYFSSVFSKDIRMVHVY